MLDHLRKRRNQMVGTFDVLVVGKTIISVPALESCWIKMPELFVEWAQFDSGTRVSERTGLNPSSWVSIENFVLVLECSVKTHWFFPCSGILMDQTCQEMLLVPGCQTYIIQTLFSSALLVSFFRQSVNQYPSTCGGAFISKYHKNFSPPQNWSAG